MNPLSKIACYVGSVALGVVGILMALLMFVVSEQVSDILGFFLTILSIATIGLTSIGIQRLVTLPIRWESPNKS